jgi:lipopolysaccharide export LptBFGC system permease protein LptF
MLFLYFLKRFYTFFFAFFAILVLVFASGDMVIRLPMLSSFFAITKIFFLMFPLMAQFSVPIASFLAVGLVCGNLHLHEEVVMIQFFSQARKTLQYAVFVFSISIVLLYIPLVFVWVPQSYHKGKDFILNVAKKQFYQLEPNKFYNLVPGFTLFFKNKACEDTKLVFEKLLLMASEKKGKDRYIINAKRGYLVSDALMLEDGVIQNISMGKHYVGSFAQTHIDLNRFFNIDKDKKNPKHLKFFDYNDLKTRMFERSDVLVEFFKRIAQILWQCLFPFLALCIMMVFSRKKSNLLIAVACGGLIFLFSYICLNVAQTLYYMQYGAVLLMFVPMMLVFGLCYVLYAKKR